MQGDARLVGCAPYIVREHWALVQVRELKRAGEGLLGSHEPTHPTKHCTQTRVQGSGDRCKGGCGREHHQPVYRGQGTDVKEGAVVNTTNPCTGVRGPM